MRERRRRALPLVAAMLLASIIPLVGTAPAHAADTVDFGTPTATTSFGDGVSFGQPLALSAAPTRTELLLTFPGSPGPLVLEAPGPRAAGATTARLTYGGRDAGHLLPNTAMDGRWRITAADGSVHLGPSVHAVYADDRFDWRTRSGDVVRVHWYQGSDAFARRALAIGEQAVAKAEKLLGVEETEPIDFFVYADQQAFYDALGPGTRENVGGQANSDIRTLFALITPSEIDDSWVSIVVPHELTHLVFDTATANDYNQPPRWLNEGLAVYLAQGYDDSDRGLVRDAASAGELIPLDGLTGQFPTSRDGFFLAYAESVAAVDFLVRTYGQDALVSLIRSYADGTSDDDAFRAALGLDTHGFGAAWFADLGVPTPSPLGPQPDLVGPLPPGWAAAGGSPVPASPQASGATSPLPGIADPTGGGGTLPLAVAAIAALAVVLLGSAFVARRTRRRPQEAPDALPGATADLPDPSDRPDP